MSKIAHYLQEHLLGEVTTSNEVRQIVSTDSSVLQSMPAFVVYPKDEQDVRKMARFSWQLAERGKVLPITARGGGSGTSGGAIGSGAMVLLSAHMNRILELDVKKRTVTLEPGITYANLAQTLCTHDLFLPAYPATGYSTIGGGISVNVVGEKSVKYGDTLKCVKGLRVVLANGEVIETGPINKRDLSYKMGLATFEGQIYRAVDTLLEEQAEIINKYAYVSEAQHNSVGYNLSKIRSKSDFDLTPIFVGAQGSLGIITEATLDLAELNPTSAFCLMSIKNLESLQSILPEILKLKPSICDFINRGAIDEVIKLNPKHFSSALGALDQEIHLFIEFNDAKESATKKAIKNLSKITEAYSGELIISEKPEDRLRMEKLRKSVAALFVPSSGQKTAVPVAEDIAVPITSLLDYLKQAQRIFADNHLPFAVWGNAGSGIVRMHPMLDLSQLGDRQKFFKLSEGIYNLVALLKGSVSASAGEGRVKAPYVHQLYGPEFAGLVHSVKAIFDPYNFLNPGVKTASINDVKALLVSHYSLARRHEHRPRS